jgi:uncharacterized protein YggE
MKNQNTIAILVLVSLSLFFLTVRNIEWGKVRYLQSETVTVTGEAKTTQKNQIASFNAGVNVIKTNKDEAVTEVNQKMDALIKAVKSFGIAETDIKTQNMSVYQQQDPSQPKVNGNWSVNNSVEITLRNIDKVNELTDLLNKSGANNVYGPNFRIDDTNSIEKTLYDAAIQDAKDKATLIAKASGRKLGKVIVVNDGGTVSNIYPMYNSLKTADGMGGGAVSEPGSATVSKTLTVSFEFN